MNLPDHQIAWLCRERGMVTPFDPEMINPASIDVRLGHALLIESAESRDLIPYPLHQHSEQDPYLLKPGQFVLAPTIEAFKLPDTIAAQFMLKSSRAREGLGHLLAGYCDPGWHGVLTMELHNVRQLHPVPLWPGMRIGQMVFRLMDTRPDWHSEDRRIVVDVKTTKDASRAEFAKSIANLDYHVQAAWNQGALEAEQFLTIAVENTRPFAVAVYPASGAMIAAGQRRIQAAMTLLAECWATGVWPGYGDLVAEPIELPGWCRD